MIEGRETPLFYILFHTSINTQAINLYSTFHLWTLCIQILIAHLLIDLSSCIVSLKLLLQAHI